MELSLADDCDNGEGRVVEGKGCVRVSLVMVTETGGELGK